MGCCLKQRPHTKLVNKDDFIILIEIEKKELKDLKDYESFKISEWKKALILLIISAFTELQEKIENKNFEEQSSINVNDMIELFDAYYDLKEKVVNSEEDDNKIFNNEASKRKMESVYRDHFFKKLNTFLEYSQEDKSNTSSFISANY